MGELEIPPDEYAGPATVSTGSTSGDAQISVRVNLRGHFEPLDGRFHWFGRIEANDELTATIASGDTVVLTTPDGSAVGRLSDVDPWGRFRITGTGRPPF